MRAANFLCASLLLILLACKGLQFTDGRSDSNRNASVDATDATNPDDDANESIALEPTAVGGAYLGCFVDRQINPELLKDLPETTPSLPVGCQAFDDANFSHSLGRSGLSIDSAELRMVESKEVLSILPVENHPRWSWLAKVPSTALGIHLHLKVRADTLSQPQNIRVELLDILPASIAANAFGLTSGSYLLRVKGSSLCLDGNPIWSWDAANSKPITESLQQKECADALKFQFASFQNGLRLHVLNPKPYACDTANYAVEFCSDSCVDLEDFGLGNRFVLFACTKSVEAQSYQMLPGSRGAIRLQANGRFMHLSDKVLVPSTESSVEFELVPMP